MDKFNLLHTALYAKHWYKHSDCIWDDLKKTLAMDNYQGDLMTKNNIVFVILDHCQKIPNQLAFTSLYKFTKGISESECWIYGYATKGNSFSLRDLLPEYDINEAVVRYCLSNISFLSPEELGGVVMPKPDFKKCLPKPKAVTHKLIKNI
jgi:hypothetical protein